MLEDEELRILAPLALGTSRALAGDLTNAPEAETAGGSAFLLGFRAGFPGPVTGAELEARVRLAVATVRAHTRHTIIARSSDLSVVAQVEDAVVAALAPDAQPAIVNHIVRCFEAGLATGLTT